MSRIYTVNKRIDYHKLKSEQNQNFYHEELEFNFPFEREEKNIVNIVSGASENHIKSLLQMINSLYNTITYDFNLYIYDLGLSNESLNNLKRFNKIIVKKFDFSKYPSYFNIKICAGEYAWKPVIINEVANETSGYLIWFDAGNKIDNLSSFNRMIKHLESNKIYSPRSNSTIKEWTYSEVLEVFNLKNDEDALNFVGRNGAIFGFNLNFPDVKEFLEFFSKYAQDKKYIAPEGSNRTNHRQDQSLFTILFYLFHKKHNINVLNHYFDIKIHQDCD